MTFSITDSLVRHAFPLLGQRLLELAGWRRKAILFTFGILLTLALPPFFLWPLVGVSLPALIFLVMHAPSGRQRFLTGWWFGFGHFTTGFYWVAHALLMDPEKFGWLVPVAVFGIGAAGALYTGLVGWAAGVLKHHDRFSWIIGFATLWTLGEGLRSVLLTGFPWNLLGYVFNASETSLQAASLLGVYGLSWLTGFLGSLPVLFSIAPKERGTKDFIFVLCCIGAFCLLLGWGAQRLAQHPTEYVPGVKLRLVQASIDQYRKNRPEERLAIVRDQINMTLSAGHESVTHIIWPETAMLFAFNSEDRWARELGSLVPPGGVMLTGVVRRELSEDNQTLLRIFNSLSVLNEQGKILYHYDKRKLVPFGEYVPLRDILPLSKVVPGNIDFTPAASVNAYTPEHGPAFLPLICYESIFPSLSQGAWPAALLNIANDDWFGISTEPYQHFEMSRMRAVEQGVPLVRAANSGISAVVDGYGRVVAMLGAHEMGVLDAPLPKANEQPGLYASHGSLVTVLMLLFFFSLLVIRAPKRQ
jgi:apolipoprotein N-acyltransferase